MRALMCKLYCWASMWSLTSTSLVTSPSVPFQIRSFYIPSSQRREARSSSHSCFLPPCILWSIKKIKHAQFYASEIWSSVHKIVNRSPSRNVSCRHKVVIVLIFFTDAHLVELQCCTTLWMNDMPCVAECRGQRGLGCPLCFFSRSNLQTFFFLGERRGKDFPTLIPFHSLNNNIEHVQSYTRGEGGIIQKHIHCN